MSNNTDPEYGTSSLLCDYVLIHQLEKIRPYTIVDFGAGGGKNGKLAKKILGERCRLIAVEGYEKSAKMLVEQGHYHEVHHKMLQEWIDKDTGNYDMAIFGDVLEHLVPGEIHKVMKAARKKFEEIIVVTPLHNIFQGELYGNLLEIHRAYITSGFFDRYNPVEKHIVREGKWAIMNIRLSMKAEENRIYRRILWPMFHRLMIILQPIRLARPFVDFLKRYFKKYKWLVRD